MDLEELKEWFYQKLEKPTGEAEHWILGGLWSTAYALALQICRFTNPRSGRELCQKLREVLLLAQEEAQRGRK
jgi:hypothetical protein